MRNAIAFMITSLAALMGGCSGVAPVQPNEPRAAKLAEPPAKPVKERQTTPALAQTSPGFSCGGHHDSDLVYAQGTVGRTVQIFEGGAWFDETSQRGCIDTDGMSELRKRLADATFALPLGNSEVRLPACASVPSEVIFVTVPSRQIAIDRRIPNCLNTRHNGSASSLVNFVIGLTAPVTGCVTLDESTFTDCERAAILEGKGPKYAHAKGGRLVLIDLSHAKAHPLLAMVTGPVQLLLGPPGLANDQLMEAISKLTKRHEVHILLGHTVTAQNISHLKSLSELRALSFSMVADDAALSHLQGLVGLHVLNLHGTQITTKGMVHLRKLTQLRKLDLSDTQVGAAGLRHLETLRELRYLYLQNAPITERQLGPLRKKLPKLHIQVGPRITPPP